MDDLKVGQQYVGIENNTFKDMVITLTEHELIYPKDTKHFLHMYGFQLINIVTDEQILNKFVKWLSVDYGLEDAKTYIKNATITSEEVVHTVYTIKYGNGAEDKVFIGNEDVIHLNPFKCKEL